MVSQARLGFARTVQAKNAIRDKPASINRERACIFKYFRLPSLGGANLKLIQALRRICRKFSKMLNSAHRGFLHRFISRFRRLAPRC